MKYLLIALLVFPKSIFAQQTPLTFWNNRCDYKIDGTGKSFGLKIKLSIPCLWQEKEGERPHVVKKFSYQIGADLVIQNLTINKLASIATKAEVDEMFTQQGLKELCGTSGNFISGRKLKIDGLDCGEIICATNRNTPVGTVNMYSIQYFFVYKEKIVLLYYAIASTTNQKARKMFESYKPLFQGLAGNTIFLSQWE